MKSREIEIRSLKKQFLPPSGCLAPQGLGGFAC